MRQHIAISLFFSIVSLFDVEFVRADILYGNYAINDVRPGQSVPGTDLDFKLSDGWGQYPITGYPAPYAVTDLGSGNEFRAFCADIRTVTSDGFHDPTVGQSYMAHTLDSLSHSMGHTRDPLIGSDQVEMIRSLIGYTYASIFSPDGSFDDITGALAVQLAIWEVLTEISPLEYGRSDGSGTYSLLGGDFYITEASANWNSIIDQSESYLQAMQGLIGWDDLGLDYSDVNVTLYIAEDGKSGSQMLIGIDGPAATPEPASMLIFSLGLAGAFPYLRRRMKKERRYRPVFSR